jgi:NitT/TauT family transport system substrate-binding protein
MWGQLTINRDAQTAALKWSRQTCFAGRGEQDMGSVWPLRSVVALIGVSFCAFTASAKDKIVFGTNWLAEAEHGGYYQAIADGTYAAYDLDVSIKPGGPQVNTGQLLAAGALDIAIVTNSFVPLNLLKAGGETIVIGTTFQKDPQALMSHPEAGYKTLADLKGHPVLISSQAWDGYWRFLKLRFGFTDDQARKYSFSLVPFLADNTLAQQAYVTSEPFSVRAAGVNPTVFLLADYGYASYGELIMTSKKMVAEKPDVVRRFIEASITGWQHFMNGDNADAIAMIVKDNPDYSAKLATDTIGAMKQYGLVDSGDAKTLGLFAMSDERWKEFFDAMVQASLYPADLDYRAAYTTKFVNKKFGMN